MSISVRFLMDLRAIQDRGLNPTFNDLLDALDKARGAGSDVNFQKCDEHDVIRYLEDACRRREAEAERDLKELADILDENRVRGTSILSTMGTVMLDKMGHPVQCQNLGL